MLLSSFVFPSFNTFFIYLLNMVANIRKKLVKNNGFWRINAIRPKIKVKRGKMRKYENEGNAKLGGLVKELGFLFVTLKWSREWV